VNSSKENLKHTRWECTYHVAIARSFIDRTKNFAQGMLCVFAPFVVNSPFHKFFGCGFAAPGASW